VGEQNADPTGNLAQELGEIVRLGSKPRLIASIRVPALMSLTCVTRTAAGDESYDRASALVGQLETAIARLGLGSRLNEAALVLFGLDPDARDLTLQDRRDRAAHIIGIRGGWDSFRKGPEKRILREVAEQLYLLERSSEDRSETGDHAPKPALPASCQLPADIVHFTGREAELAHLRALLGDGHAERVVISAIAGTGGVGKTALALHLAHELAPNFPDAQLYVNLHGYDPRQRLSPARRSTGFFEHSGWSTKHCLPRSTSRSLATGASFPASVLSLCWTTHRLPTRCGPSCRPAPPA
jgi:hypothetical protein